jgi:hypothetical protein
MRKLFLLLFALAATSASFSQTSKAKKKFLISDRPGDHIMLQLSSDRWMGAPDSVDSRRKSLSRGGNIYVMLDKPFKGNPRFSAAFGLGVGTSSIYFDKMQAEITGNTNTLNFQALDTLTRFKKYKVTTAYLELPVELRFTSNPDKPNKTFKAAIGLKAGTLLKAYSKGKTQQDGAGNEINEFTQKLSSKRYFNTTRLVATARIGYGYLSLFGAYNITSVFKDGVASNMRLLQVGLTISGL